MNKDDDWDHFSPPPPPEIPRLPEK